MPFLRFMLRKKMPEGPLELRSEYSAIERETVSFQFQLERMLRDGLFVIHTERDSFLLPLSVARLPGVGKVTEEKAGLRGMRYAPNHQRAQGARKRRPAVKKLSTVRESESKLFKEHKLTVGLDLGDHSSYYCVLDEPSKVIQEGSVGTNKKAIEI